MSDSRGGAGRWSFGPDPFGLCPVLAPPTIAAHEDAATSHGVTAAARVASAEACTAILDACVEDGATNVVATRETPIQSRGWHRGADESLICGTLLAACIRGGSTMWGWVGTHGSFHPDRIERKGAVDCARVETAACYLRAEEVANSCAVTATIARRPHRAVMYCTVREREHFVGFLVDDNSCSSCSCTQVNPDHAGADALG
jgi:hypothetical protein